MSYTAVANENDEVPMPATVTVEATAATVAKVGWTTSPALAVCVSVTSASVKTFPPKAPVAVTVSV